MSTFIFCQKSGFVGPRQLSRVFLRCPIWIINYYIRKFVRKSQYSKQTLCVSGSYSHFVLKTIKTQAFFFEVFWRTFWHNNWKSLFDVVEKLCSYVTKSKFYPRCMKIRMLLKNQLQPIVSCFSSYSSSFNYAIKFFLFTLPNPVSSRVSARCTMCSTLRFLMKVGFDFLKEQFILAHMSFLHIWNKVPLIWYFWIILLALGNFKIKYHWL